MGTLDIVISRDKMLASPANYKLWKATMEYVFEKEDLWDCIKTIVSEEKISASGDTASNLEETRASESTRIPATRQELEILCKRR